MLKRGLMHLFLEGDRLVGGVGAFVASVVEEMIEVLFFVVGVTT
jgi:hypothetical protein